MSKIKAFIPGFVFGVQASFPLFTIHGRSQHDKITSRIFLSPFLPSGFVFGVPQESRRHLNYQYPRPKLRVTARTRCIRTTRVTTKRCMQRAFTGVLASFECFEIGIHGQNPAYQSITTIPIQQKRLGVSREFRRPSCMHSFTPTADPQSNNTTSTRRLLLLKKNSLYEYRVWLS